MECMQYTIRGIPPYLDAGLRGYAKREEKSLNAVLLEMLEKGLSLEVISKPLGRPVNGPVTRHKTNRRHA